MADGTAIEWTRRPGTKGATLNPIRARHKETGRVGWHCVHASEGCRFCYAEDINKGFFNLGTKLDYKPGNEALIDIFLDEKAVTQPLRWKAPRTIFWCSMTDMFGEFVPDWIIDRIFAVCALTPQHTHIILTKRAKRMREYFAKIADEQKAAGEDQACAPRRYDQIACDLTRSPCTAGWMEDQPWPLPNVWLGVSAERQQEADERIPDLLATPAAVRFVSAEPLLAPLDLTPWVDPLSIHCDSCMHVAHHVPHDRVSYIDDGETPVIVLCPACGATAKAGPDTPLDWVIVGGESGPDARPMHPAWARSIRDQCAAAGTAFFMKQWGAWGPIDQSDSADEAGWQGRGDWMILDQHGDVDIPDHRWPDEEAGEVAVIKVGKRRAGRLLDGVEHNAFPETAR